MHMHTSVCGFRWSLVGRGAPPGSGQGMGTRPLAASGRRSPPSIKCWDMPAGIPRKRRHRDKKKGEKGTQWRSLYCPWRKKAMQSSCSRAGPTNQDAVAPRARLPPESYALFRRSGGSGGGGGCNMKSWREEAIGGGAPGHALPAQRRRRSCNCRRHQALHVELLAAPTLAGPPGIIAWWPPAPPAPPPPPASPAPCVQSEGSEHACHVL